MKKALIVIIAVVLLASFTFVIVKSNAFSSRFSIFGKYLGQKIASNDEVIAEANGVEIKLSDLALPYFSSMVAYLQSKEAAENILNDPNTSLELKARIEALLAEKPDPVAMLNRVIGQKLLCQKIKKAGIAISDERLNEELNEIKQGQASDKPIEWTKYHNELLKALNITEDEYLNKYYRTLQEDLDLISEYEKTIDVPEPTSDEVEAIMKEYGVDEETAKVTYENNFRQNFVQSEADELFRTADVKILDIEAIKSLGNYFNN